MRIRPGGGAVQGGGETRRFFCFWWRQANGRASTASNTRPARRCKRRARAETSVAEGGGVGSERDHRRRREGVPLFPAVDGGRSAGGLRRSDCAGQSPYPGHARRCPSGTAGNALIRNEKGHPEVPFFMRGMVGERGSEGSAVDHDPLRTAEPDHPTISGSHHGQPDA